MSGGGRGRGAADARPGRRAACPSWVLAEKEPHVRCEEWKRETALRLGPNDGRQGSLRPRCSVGHRSVLVGKVQNRGVLV